MSLIHLEFILGRFIYMVKFYSSTCGEPVFSAPLFKVTVFPTVHAFALFLKYQVAVGCGYMHLFLGLLF